MSAHFYYNTVFFDVVHRKELSTPVPKVYLSTYTMLYKHNEEKDGLAIRKVMKVLIQFLNS